jgi:hypothetical protein
MSEDKFTPQPPAEKPEVRAPHIRILREGDHGEWKAVPKKCPVKKSQTPWIIIAGPHDSALENLEEVCFDDPAHHEAFGGTPGQPFVPNAQGRVALSTRGTEYNIEYKYSFRVGDTVVDPKIIIERP